MTRLQRDARLAALRQLKQACHTLRNLGSNVVACVTYGDDAHYCTRLALRAQPAWGVSARLVLKPRPMGVLSEEEILLESVGEIMAEWPVVRKVVTAE